MKIFGKSDDDKVVGIDHSPIVEIGGYDSYQQHNRWIKGLEYAALAAVTYAGFNWIREHAKVNLAPESLSYLTKGLNRSGESTWWEAAGLEKDAEGKIEVGLNEFLMEGTKRFEESVAGLPRTFGLFGAESRALMTSTSSKLRITPKMLEGAESHYEAVIGRKFTPHESLHGFVTGEVTPQHLTEYYTENARAKGLSHSPLDIAKQIEEDIASGNLNPDKLPGLFSVTEKGEPYKLVRPDVRIGVRRWNIDSADIGVNKVTGKPRFQQIIEDADYISEALGARPIHHTNEATMFVYRAPDNINLSTTAKEVVDSFGSSSELQEAIKGKTTEAVRNASMEVDVLAKRATKRTMKLFDNPTEAISDLLGKHVGTTQTEEKSFGMLRNIFGTGGEYSGQATDIWARHASRVLPLLIGAAAVYEAGSFITKAITGNSVAQLGGQAIGAAQRTFAGISDITGLTALNKKQKEKAEGSHSLLGVLAIPFSGYLTGRVLASGYNAIEATKTPGKTAWEIAREEVHELPSALKLTESEVPVIGNLSKKMTRGQQFGLVGAAIGAIAAAPFLLGSLGSSESYDEVSAEQAGETEVAVRKGRYWEMNRTPFEGESISYYRPGWYKRLMDDPGAELEDAGYSDRPFTRGLKDIFTPYWKEKALYYDRPYPTSGPDTSSFGPLGSLWGMTIGRVLKAPITMHDEEISQGTGDVADGKVISYERNASTSPASSMGAEGRKPFGLQTDQSYLAKDFVFKAEEAVGLPGFVAGSIYKRFNDGRQIGADQQVLASASSIGSMRDKFWELNIGGGATLTEGPRRFMPKERHDIQRINPVANNMPSWMPGVGNYIDFTHGDPYSAIEEGIYRLPGSGYEARNPELKGIDPEDYPDIHKYRILADVAPFSKEFESISSKMSGIAESGQMSERDYGLYQATKTELEERRHKIHFRNEPDSLIGQYWAGITSLGRINPVEHLLPFSPIHKFAGPTDPISEYKDSVVYSTSTPSWDTPYQDFIKPAINNTGRILGFDGIPKETKERRDLVGFFDKLDYIKNKRLEANARAEGDGRAAYAYARKAQYTMFGADPYADLETVEKVLPEEDRKFFEAFVAEDRPDKRGEILKLVPEYTKKFYVAQWQKKTYAALAAKGDLSSDELDAARQIEAARATEGQATDPSMWTNYRIQTMMGTVREDTFPDYIRAQTLQRYFDTNTAPYDMPAADWVGYSPAIDSDMVKTKMVQNLGMDFHDFALWDQDVINANNTPMAERAASELSSNTMIRDSTMKSLASMKIRDLSVDVTPTMSTKNRVTIDVKQNRREDIDRQLRKAGIG